MVRVTFDEMAALFVERGGFVRKFAALIVKLTAVIEVFAGGADSVAEVLTGFGAGCRSSEQADCRA
jgi:hypothetical protein